MKDDDDDEDEDDPPLPLPATETSRSREVSGPQLRDMTSRSSIRSLLGLNFTSYAMGEDPTPLNGSLSNLSAGRAKSISSLDLSSAFRTGVAASASGEPSRPDVLKGERVVSPLAVAAADTTFKRTDTTKPESVTPTNEDAHATSKRKSRNRTTTPPNGRRPRHSTSNSETISSGAWIFGGRTATTTTTSTITAISVTNPEDPLSTTTAPVNHDTATLRNLNETEKFMLLRTRSLNDQRLPRAPRSSSQGSERSPIDRKPSLLSIAALSTHIMAMHADTPPTAPSSSSSPPIKSDQAEESSVIEAKEETATDHVDEKKTEDNGEGQSQVVPPKTLEMENSKRPGLRTRESRPLSISSSWWPFVSSSSPTPNSPDLQTDPPVTSNPVSETNSNAASITPNNKVGEMEEGKVLEAPPQQSQPAPYSSPSLLSLRGASELMFGMAAFSRKRSVLKTTDQGGGRDAGNDAAANSDEGSTLQKTVPAVAKVVNEAESETAETATSTMPLSPSPLHITTSEVSQAAPPATKVTLLQTANFVLPQLPLPPELGILPSPGTPTTPSRSPSLLLNAPASILPEYTADSIVSKALGAIGNMIWSKADWHGEHLGDKISKNGGNIHETKCEWPKEIRKIAIIGVHGWFPIKLFQRVIGEPTGTSPRFCTDMQSAILHHIQMHHPNNPQNPEITLIPLEGEGKVLDRVGLLHTALHARPDWVEALRTADCVFVATHSQGAPVSTLLLSKLLAERVDIDGSVQPPSTAPSEGKEIPSQSNVQAKKTESDAVTTEPVSEQPTAHPILDPPAVTKGLPGTDAELKNGVSETVEETDIFDPRPYLLDPKRQRIGMLAMAGISHGPFPFLKSNLIVRYLEAEAARELFEFMDCPGEEGSMDSSAAGFEDSLGGSTKREKKKDMELSRAYWKAMKDVLDKGVKVTCVASMADQVVPLYSATMHALSHPNLLRALYIDAPAAQEATSISQTGHKPVVPPISVELVSLQPSSDPAAAWENPSSPIRSSTAPMVELPLSVPTSSPTAKTNLSHFPSSSSLVTDKPGPADLDFLTNLIVFALRLRNAGLSDHGLIVHLSEAVAGSLYGTGHSTIYEEPEVYSLAFKWLLTPKRTPQSSFLPQRPPSNHPSPHSPKRGPPKAPSSASNTLSNIPVMHTLHPATNILGTTPLSRPSFTSSKPPLSASSNIQPPSTQPNQLPHQQARNLSTLMYSIPLFTPPISESQLEYFTATSHLNPYYLPWIIRALLGDPLVAANPDLAMELQGIVRQFKSWEPREKAMRDLKYRLEPLRSHL